MEQIIFLVILVLLVAYICIRVERWKMLKKLDRERAKSAFHYQLFMMMMQWVRLKQEGVNLSDELKKKGFQHIAIWGMNVFGERLVKELKNTDVKVDYAVDRDAANKVIDVNLITPEDELKPVDAVVVTLLDEYDEIEEMLLKKLCCPVIAVDDLLYQ